MAWLAAVSLVTAGWIGAGLAGWDLPFEATARGAAAAAACAALAGAAWRPRPGPSAFAAAAGLLLLPLGVAGAAGGSATLLAATLVVVAASGVAMALRERGFRRRYRMVAATGLAAAAACLAAGMAVDGGAGASHPLPSGELASALLGAAAAVLLVLVASLGPSEARPLAAPALLIGLVAVPGLPELAVAGAAAAAAIAWALRAPSRPVPALAALALGAAALPAAGQASDLLAAAAILGLAVPHPAAAVLGVPGAAALASVLAAGSLEWSLLVVGVGVAATALLLSRCVSSKTGPKGDVVMAHVHVLPALGLAAWLVLSPGSWGWTGGSGLGTYDRGALIASAAAMLAMVGRRARALSPPSSS